MAKIEAGLRGFTATEIIDYLTENSNRSRDAIKKRRQLASFQALVSSFRAPPTEPTPPSSPYGTEDTPRLDLEILSYLTNLPNNNLEVDDSELISAIEGDRDRRNAIKNYYDSIVLKFSRDHTTFRQTYS